MEDNNFKWTISKHDEYYNEGEYFDTREEAIEFGLNYFEGNKFYIGQVEAIPMRADDLGDVCIEYISQAHAHYDGEWAQDYLDDVTMDHSKELNGMIEKVVLEWATKHNYHPTFFNVYKIEEITGG